MDIQKIKKDSVSVFENTACKQTYQMVAGVESVVDFVLNAVEEKLKSTNKQSIKLPKKCLESDHKLIKRFFKSANFCQICGRQLHTFE
jgi:hypothetical protein